MLNTLHIEANGIPIYVQLREQLLRAIGAGELRPGARMPTMREVAVALKVDLNTVRHAYEDLEQLGAIVMRRARGTFVADAPATPDRASASRRLEQLVQQVLALSRSAGIEPAELAAALTREPSRTDL